LLVQKGATPDAHSLFAAIDFKLLNVLETLLAAGLDPNIRRTQDSKGQNTFRETMSESEEYPLWVAATRHGIMEDKTADEKREARNIALKTMNLLLVNGADPFAMFERENSNNISERDDATVEEGKESALISAEELDAEAKFQTSSILHDLLEHGNLVHPILKLSYLDVQRRDLRGRTVLHAACRSQAGVHAPIDILLTETDTEENSREKAPSFLHHLLSKGADLLAVDDQARNILHLMLATTNVYRPSCHPILHALPLLCDANIAVLVTQADTYGNTPLHLALRYAIRQSDASPAEALLKAGADPFAQDNRGNTALHLLAYRVLESEASRSLFSKMLERGLDINARNAAGQTPVFNLNKSLPSYILRVESNIAEHTTPSQALALFEDAGADFFVTDKQGQGLLHIAARLLETLGHEFFKLHVRMMRKPATRFELLVNKGLDVAMEDEQKRTALDVAVAYGNQRILKLFDKDNARNKITAAEIEDEFDSENDSDYLG
jgi:ankyrin repeat protein